MPHVVCTSLNSESGPHLKLFADAGFTVGFVPEGRNLFREDELIETVKEADAIVAGSEPYTPRVIAGCPKLRAIARTGVGFDAVNLPACDAAKIPVCTTPGVNHHSVAEQTIAMLMGLARGFPELDVKVREGRWKRTATPRVMGQTLGLLGLGRIGQAVAWRAAGLGMNVIAYEPFPNVEFVKQWRIQLVGFEELLKRSDFVSLHLPATAETFGIINTKTLALMKPTAILLNTARGTLINETDLHTALTTGKLRAAGLDVFQVEPLPVESPLTKLPNVLLSGHVAGLDQESSHDTFKMAAEIIIGLHRGDWPHGCVQNLKGVKNWTW